MIQSAQKIQFQTDKIAQYEAELFQLREKIEEIEAAKAVCETRLSGLKITTEKAKGKRKIKSIEALDGCPPADS